MGEKGPIGKLGLVLELDPVLDFMVPHHMLEDHDVQHLPGPIMGELALVDESSYPGIEDADAFIRQLVHIQEELISELPSVVFILDCGHMVSNTC